MQKLYNSRKIKVVITLQYLRSLQGAEFADFDSAWPERSSICLDGTRREILKTVTDWGAAADEIEPRILCISGSAGSGKTSIARTIAERAQSNGMLGATFFFSYQSDENRQNPALVFPRLAYQFAESCPEFAEALLVAVDAAEGSRDESLAEQFDRLLVKPVLSMENGQQRAILVTLDGLD